jgi:hypothetical protein
MPFHQIYPRSLTFQSISRFAPAASGVFGISSASKWLYIGETDNIQLTLLSLLDRQQEPAANQKLVGFAFELCDAGSRLSRQQRLRLEYAATAVSF